MKNFFTALVYAFCILAFLVTSASIAICQSSIVKEVLPDEQCRSQLGNMRYQNGYFTAVRRVKPRDPTGQEVVVLDKDGHCVFRSLPGQGIPEAQVLSLYDAFLGSQGLLAVVSVAVSRNGQMAYILVLYQFPSNRIHKIVRINPIFATEVVVDEHNDIWMLGYDTDKAAGNQDHGILYKLSPDGNVLGKFVMRSSISSANLKFNPLLPDSYGASELFINQHGQLYACLANQQIVLEINLDGKVITQTKLPEFSPNNGRDTTFTIQQNGTIIGLFGNGIYRLNTQEGVWVAIKSSISVGKLIQLAGCDDQNVILRDRRTGKLLWVPTKS
jgi:hypothetical protein